jgi:hypothetical protein
MSLSTFSIVLAVVCVLLALPMLWSPAAMTDWLLRLTQDKIVYRLFGASFLVLCWLPLIENPSLTFDLAGLITALAVWGVIKCLVICWWPNGHSRIIARLLADSPNRQRACGAIIVFFGMVFAWIGLMLR